MEFGLYATPKKCQWKYPGKEASGIISRAPHPLCPVGYLCHSQKCFFFPLKSVSSSLPYTLILFCFSLLSFEWCPSDFPTCLPNFCEGPKSFILPRFCYHSLISKCKFSCHPRADLAWFHTYLPSADTSLEAVSHNVKFYRSCNRAFNPPSQPTLLHSPGNISSLTHLLRQ